jgi:hypothetical protein
MKFGHFKDSGCVPRRNFGPTAAKSRRIAQPNFLPPLQGGGRYKKLTQAEAWAMISRPFGPQNCPNH